MRRRIVRPQRPGVHTRRQALTKHTFAPGTMLTAMSELQLGLFGGGVVSINDEAVPERTELDGGAWVEVRRAWLLGSDTLCEELIRDVPWGQHRRRMYNRVVDEPRLTWRSGEEKELPHGGLRLAGEALERIYEVPLVGPGLNYYRDGRDSVAFHGDRELRDLSDTLVAIVSPGGDEAVPGPSPWWRSVH